VLWGENDFLIAAHVAEAEPVGDEQLDVELDSQQIYDSENDSLWIGELQLGLQWAQPYQCFGGGVMFVRSVFEAQWWAHPSFSGGDSEDLAFYGLAFGAGFSH
jgi:hypothetical protein